MYAPRGCESRRDADCDRSRARRQRSPADGLLPDAQLPAQQAPIRFRVLIGGAEVENGWRPARYDLTKNTVLHEAWGHPHESENVRLSDRLEVLHDRRSSHRRLLRALTLPRVPDNFRAAGDFHLPARVLLPGGRLVQQESDFGTGRHLADLRVVLH